MVDGIDIITLVEAVFDEEEPEEELIYCGSYSKSLISNGATNQAVGCIGCNMYFINEGDLDSHEDNCKDLDSLTEKSLSSRFPCTLCTATFRRQDHLKRHLNSVHSDTKLHKCPVCSEDCARYDILSKHIRSKHSNEPCTFHCRNCTYKCNTLSEFEIHERTHLLTERHLCPHCNTSFKRRDHMLRHVKSQHLLEHINCPICSQTFKRRDHVTRHMREKHSRPVPVDKICT